MLTKYLERRALLAIARGLQDHMSWGDHSGVVNRIAKFLGVSLEEVDDWDGDQYFIPVFPEPYTDGKVLGSFVYKHLTTALQDRHDFYFDLGITPLIEATEYRRLTPAEEKTALQWIYEQYVMEQRGELNNFTLGRALVFLTEVVPGPGIGDIQDWNSIVRCVPEVHTDFAPYMERTARILKGQFGD